MQRRPIALLDACVLAPMPIADTLLRLAEKPVLYEVKWSEEILNEVTRTLTGRFGRPAGSAIRRESTMRACFPNAIVAGYEPLATRLTNHPKDRHVLAAALWCHADYLVTFNLKDFVTHDLGDLPLQIVDPAAFLGVLWTLDRAKVKDCLREQSAGVGLTSPCPAKAKECGTRRTPFCAC